MADPPSHQVYSTMRNRQGRRTRPLGQTIALAFAVLAYAAAGSCAIAVMLYRGTADADPVQASFIAAAIFFIGCGVVLQVIGNARLQGLLSGPGGNEMR